MALWKEMCRHVKKCARPTCSRPPEERDTVLATVGEILSDLHLEYYAAATAQDQLPTTASVLQRLQPKYRHYPAWCLAGVCILFSSVVPQRTKPAAHEYWQRALSMGARCVTEFTPEVTHVVARVPNTEKVYAAMRSSNVYLVHVRWLERCFIESARADERDFPLTDKHPVIQHFAEQAQPVAHELPVSSPVATGDEADDGDEDVEQLAADMAMDAAYMSLSAEQVSAMDAEVDAELAGLSDGDDEDEAIHEENQIIEDQESGEAGQEAVGWDADMDTMGMGSGPADAVTSLDEWARLARKRKVNWLDEADDTDDSGGLVPANGRTSPSSSESGSDVSLSFVEDIESAI